MENGIVSYQAKQVVFHKRGKEIVIAGDLRKKAAKKIKEAHIVPWDFSVY